MLYSFAKPAFFLLLWFTALVNADAQYKFGKAAHFTVKEGLPGNRIRFIEKGLDGFVWIGTSDGLCRFDGAQFEVYQYDPENPYSIIDNRTACIAVDTHAIWVGTHMGLARLDLRTEQFTNYQFSEKGMADSLSREGWQQVQSLLLDRAGELWVGTRYWGLARYVREKDDFLMYTGNQSEVARHFPEPKSIHNILSLEQHRFNDSLIWGGTSVGLLEINKYTHSTEWLPFNLEISIEKRWGNVFKEMYHHHDGMVYAGNWGGGITVFNPERRYVKVLDVSNQAGLSVLRGATHKLVEKNELEFWITSVAGLASYHAGTRKVTFFRENDEQVYGVEFIDEHQRAWAKSDEGLFVFDPMLQQFDSYSFDHLNTPLKGMVFNIVPTPSSDTLLIAARGTHSIFHFTLSDESWSLTPVPEQFLDDHGQFHARYAALSPDGELAISYPGGLLLYDPKERSFRPFPSMPPIREKFINHMLWDSKGRLWASTFNEGISRWDPQSGKWAVFDDELKADDPGLQSNTFNYLLEDSRGNVWFKREQGIGIYLAEQDTFIQHLYSLHPERCFPYINNMVEDKQGRIWMNSSEGLIGYAEVDRPEKGLVKKINLNELDNIFVKGIFRLRVGPQGNIWGWGEKSIIKIQSGDLSVSQYSFLYGEDNPEYHTFRMLPTGELVFGATNRIIIADPRALRHNEEKPAPYLKGINVLEESYREAGSPLLARQLHLRHWENFFSFDFSARGFTLGKQNRFRYRLKGFEDNWINAKGRRNANYTNVPPGDYTFQLQAANNEGVWNEDIFELPVAIASPWWSHWWFIAGALLLLAYITYSLYRYRIGQIRREEKLKSDFEKQLANVEMSALRAQMNPHFLFNSLNSIERFIIKNESRKASEYLNNFARLIRLILQNSRSNYVNLKDEIEALELYLQMENLRFQDKFNYELIIQEGLEIETIDIPPMLIQPYVENAIWHGLMHKKDKTEGKVALHISRNNGYLRCSIEDNGIGRAKALEMKTHSPQRGKRSVGMQITQDRIKIINKLYNSNTTINIIDLKNGNGEAAGTRVELNIPV